MFLNAGASAWRRLPVAGKPREVRNFRHGARRLSFP
jgi:hypothetical protein